MGRAEQVLSGLASLQKEGMFCDIELQAEGQTLSAHRNVLAAASPYFHAMFSGNFKETNVSTVPMQEISFAGLKAIVDCIYTTKIKPNAKNISDIVPAAHLLQMNDIVKECREWMTGKVTKTNCFTLLKLAETFSFEEVQASVHEFIMHDFVAVSKTKQFKEISQAALCAFLSSDTLRTCLKEMEVFQAAKAWIRYHSMTDKQTIVEILKNVRFALLPLGQLSEMFDEDIIIENAECKKMVKEATNYHSNVYMQPLYDGSLNRPRGKPGVMIIPAGTPGNGYNIEGNGDDEYFLDYPNFTKSKTSSALKTPIVLEIRISYMMLCM